MTERDDVQLDRFWDALSAGKPADAAFNSAELLPVLQCRCADRMALAVTFRAMPNSQQRNESLRSCGSNAPRLDMASRKTWLATSSARCQSPSRE